MIATLTEAESRDLLVRQHVEQEARVALHHFDHGRVHVAAAVFVRRLELNEATKHLVADWTRARRWLMQVISEEGRTGFEREINSLAPDAPQAT